MRIPPPQVYMFLEKRGWTQIKSPIFVDAVAFQNPVFSGRQLFLPRDEAASDYEDAIDGLLNKLSAIEQRSVNSLQSELERTNSLSAPEGNDVLALRVLKVVNSDESIPLVVAKAALVETESMLMSSSCLAERPAKYYRRIDNKLSNEVRDLATFNHTKRGSFVISVSCPVFAPFEQTVLDLDSATFTKTRRAFVAMSMSIQALSAAIDDGRVKKFTDDLESSQTPVVSSNFCGALANILAVEEGDGISLDIQWSNLLPPPPNIAFEKPVVFRPSAAEALFEISTKLRPVDQALSGRFLGTVEVLRGDIGADGQRVGSVEFAILLKDGVSIRASAHLDQQQYRMADEAHIAGTRYVAITGLLEPRARVWNFSDIQKLELV